MNVHLQMRNLTLPKMIGFQTSSKAAINIFQQIGTSFRDLGLLLLDDKHRAIVSQKHHNLSQHILVHVHMHVPLKGVNSVVT